LSGNETGSSVTGQKATVSKTDREIAATVMPRNIALKIYDIWIFNKLSTVTILLVKCAAFLEVTPYDSVRIDISEERIVCIIRVT
jgi:hypothetical protein